MTERKRVAVASIIQETNTFARTTSTLADFEAQGLWAGHAAVRRSAGTNTEFAGEAVPLVRAWAMSGGVLADDAFEALRSLLLSELAAVEAVDGVLLCLRGALVSDRAGFAGLYDETIVLDLPGASTPALRHLESTGAPRPPHLIDELALA